MSTWEPLPEGVTWSIRPLFSFRASRATIERRFGVPMLVNGDSNGMGPIDAWAMRFGCGLELCLWIFHLRPDGSTIDDPHEPAWIEVQASAAQEAHILFHLELPVSALSRWESATFLPEPAVWRLVRQDDNGVRAEVARYTSQCEAATAATAFEERHHKQTYWVEEARWEREG